MDHSQHRQRLWEKLKQRGFRNAFILPYEQLEFLLTFVIPRRDTKPTAKLLIEYFGSVHGALFAKPESLMRVPGLGEKSAQFLAMLGELYQSMSEASLQQRNLLTRPELVARYLEHELTAEDAEVFLVLHLDAKNRLIRSERLFRGTIDRSAVFPREVAKQGLAFNARSMIVAHNHPSGDPTPSRADLNLTSTLRQALGTVDIILHDHFVVARAGTQSLRELHPQLWAT